MTESARRLKNIAALLLALAGCAAPPAAKPPKAVAQPAAAQEATPPKPSATPTISDIWQTALAGRNKQARALLERRFPKVLKYPEWPRPLGHVRLSALDDGRWAVPFRGGYLILNASGRPQRFVPLALMDTDWPHMQVVPDTSMALCSGHILDVDSGRLVGQLPAGEHVIGRGRVAVIEAGKAPAMLVRDVRANAALARASLPLGVHPERVRFSADASLLFMRSTGGKERVYDASTLHEIAQFGPAQHTSAALTPDGKLIALASTHDGPTSTVELVDRDTAKVLARSQACGPHRSIAISPDGKHLAVAGERVCVLSLPSLRKLGDTPPVKGFAEAETSYVSFLSYRPALAAITHRGATSFFTFPDLRLRFSGAGSWYELPSGEIERISSGGRVTRLDRDFHEHFVRTIRSAFLAGSDDARNRAPEVFDVLARLSHFACDLSPYIVPCEGGSS